LFFHIKAYADVDGTVLADVPPEEIYMGHKKNSTSFMAFSDEKREEVYTAVYTAIDQRTVYCTFLKK